MGYIDNLLRGRKVEWKTLGEVAEVRRGTLITKKDSRPGKYPVISGGQQPAYYIDKYNRQGEVLTIAGSGAYAGYVMYWNEPIYVNDACSIVTREDCASMRFVYHFLLMQQERIYGLKSGGGVPHVYPKTISALPIPVPPLDVQAEIARFLDRFTALEAELEAALKAELEARQKQYEYYRDRLLSAEGIRTMYGEAVKPIALGDLGTFTRGTSIQKKDFIPNGGVGCIHYGQIYTLYGLFTHETKSFVSHKLAQKARKAHKGDLVIATTSENDTDLCKAVAWLGNEDIAVSSDACFYTHSMDPKYVSYYFQSDVFQTQKRQYITGTKVRRVNPNDLAKITIPLPSLHVQEEIVRILDKFSTLTTSLTAGLPREIALRRRQYEYYREQLLTFE